MSSGLFGWLLEGSQHGGIFQEAYGLFIEGQRVVIRVMEELATAQIPPEFRPT